MINIKASRRYALAIMGIVDEMKNLDQVSEDFELIERMIKEVREFALFLKNPIIKKEKKKQILSVFLKGRVSDLALQFVEFVTSKKRENLFPEIIQQFYQLRDERLNILNVPVQVAAKITTSQEQQLIKRLEDVTKKKVRLKYEVDPSLIGGFKAQYGDTVWDATAKRQLEWLMKIATTGAK